MKKLILALTLGAVALVAQPLKYVGDDRARDYYENPKVLNAFTKQGVDRPIIVGYFKAGMNGKMKLSSSKRCCVSVSLAGGGCMPLEVGKEVAE